MQAAIPFPDISPELFSVEIGGFAFALRWYALAYIAALLIGWWAVVRLLKAPRLWPGETPPMTPAQPEALLTWIILGVVLGGRLGFVLFYQPGYYLSHPAEIPMIWQGGMSFHGGALGVVVAALGFCWKNGVPVGGTFDALAAVTPVGLLLGRLANFVNAELWGRPTEAPWGVIFPGAQAQDCGPGWPVPCARHPSQLYEAGLEGLVLGLVILWLVTARGALKAPGQITGIFIAGYGAARTFVEGFRQADAQFIEPGNPWGHVIRFGGGPDAPGLTMGQTLSLPMVAVGLVIALVARRRAP
ncbi:prolipoprotein diacylglyceryl transferase [Maritimibacter sp. 55A14]|uniref:prolipoprotein diacylglyceryl transferase n=1 Tax=Maritimibacter sp. 55A14 TaxID=2174844 RepID=UPI000D60B9C5|nr:prolipoprotein diacylglyceryl transferase [Maritimibacter sp. 55A14]PWE29442.1 prolipoprotein diacylglyceryl transferase [Maritimibacter sp. 55A14]